MTLMVKDDSLAPVVGLEPGGGVAAPIAGARVIRRPDPRTQYVVSGKVRSTDDPLALPESIDDLTRVYGFTAYDALMAIPAVSSSIRTLKLGIMSGDIQLVETHQASYTLNELTPEQKMSAEVKDFCERLLNRVPGFRQSLFQMLDATLYGNKLGEMTADVATSGPDRGRLVLKTFTVKHRKSWLFVVDDSLVVQGILARGGTDRLGWVILPPEKFMWLTWMPQNNDPRGTSAARPAYTPANLSVQLYAQYFKYLKQFASPSIIGQPDPESESIMDDLTGTTISPEMYLASQLELFENGSYLVIPANAKATILQSSGNGEAFMSGFNYLNQEMVFSILLQTRATREAQYGSKADSETGSDILDLVVGYGRDVFGDTIRNQMLKPFVAANFGQEAADEFTPWVYFGSVDPKDTVARWNALANLYRANAVSKSTQQEWHARADAPIPDQEVDAESDQAQANQGQGDMDQPDGNQDTPGSGQDATGAILSHQPDRRHVQPRKLSMGHLRRKVFRGG